ncbi:hypothetical protein CEXT_141751 [Caerostris extrusa]|uniref:Uncharacterized protein n=1 Tax=Caerostris extrusa TaxID=172846 RepID=A0AAV4YFP3_CAEEX|nr:hypothetical protein CEXT_141751 [Caerostris extrusa]
MEELSISQHMAKGEGGIHDTRHTDRSGIEQQSIGVFESFTGTLPSMHHFSILMSVFWSRIPFFGATARE